MDDEEKDDFTFDEEQVFGTTYPKKSFEDELDEPSGGGESSWGGKLSRYEGDDPKTRVMQFLQKNWKLLLLLLFVFFVIFLVAIYLVTRSGTETVSPNSPCWPVDNCQTTSTVASESSQPEPAR